LSRSHKSKRGKGLVRKESMETEEKTVGQKKNELSFLGNVHGLKDVKVNLSKRDIHQRREKDLERTTKW